MESFYLVDIFIMILNEISKLLAFHKCIQQSWCSPNHSSDKIHSQRCPGPSRKSYSPGFSSHWVHPSSSQTIGLLSGDGPRSSCPSCVHCGLHSRWLLSTTVDPIAFLVFQVSLDQQNQTKE